MKRARLFLLAVLSLSLAAGLCLLAACGAGGVAATVNGQQIMEADITESIEAMRDAQEGYADDVTWAQVLASSDLTPQTLRETVINSRAREIVITQEADSQGIYANEEEVDATIEQTKATVGGDDTTWQETLTQYGYQSEEAYRNMLLFNDVNQKLYDAFVAEASDDDLKTYIAANPTAVEGYTYTAEGGTETAAEDEAATDGEEATEDEAAEEDVAAEDEAASEDVATDESALTADSVDLTAIPADILEQYKELWSEANKALAYNTWTEELIENADIVINEMPEDVSYNVDMSLATSTTDDETSVDPTTPDESTASSSSAESVEAALAEGLIITDDVVGDGDEAVDGSTVKVLYTGTLEDGTIFDSTENRDNEPYAFTLGVGTVIRGWDAGVVGMKVGGTRTLTIPASLAYGSTGTESIPADATLTFVIELVEVTQN